MSVPQFKAYWPSIGMLNTEQRAFYDYLTSEIKKGRYPSVEGNISYLFIYTYPFVRDWDQKGHEYVHDRLLDLAEAYYQEATFVWYCKHWAYECLLALKKYDEYLDLTAPDDILPSYTFNSNERCNIFYHIGRPAYSTEVLSLFGWKNRARLTKHTQRHLSLFADLLEDVFVEEAERNGPWLQRLLQEQTQPEIHHKTLFVGVPMSNKPILPFVFYNFRAEYSRYVDIIAGLARIAENRLREQQNLPLIGEGWISETELYYAVKKAFPQTQVVQHGHPNWLGKQHFDIWLPRWKIAIEYHGRQHFEPVEFFGGIEAFNDTVRRDEQKARLCEQNRTQLIIATSEAKHEDVIERIQQMRARTVEEFDT